MSTGVGESFSSDFIRIVLVLAGLVRGQLGLEMEGCPHLSTLTMLRIDHHNKQSFQLPLWKESHLEEHTGRIWGLKGISWYTLAGPFL